MTKKYIGSGLVNLAATTSYSPNLNVLNILRSVEESAESTLYIPRDLYNAETHSGELTSDFKEVKGLVSANDRFNFSVQSTDTNNWRTYTVIRDGKLNMDFIYARVSKDTYDMLHDLALITEDYIPGNVYKISLTNIPLVSPNWSRPNALGLYEKLVQDIELGEEAKVLRKIVKEYKAQNPSTSSEKKDYTKESSDGPTKEVSCVEYKITDAKFKFDIDELKDLYPDLESANARLYDVTRLQRVNRFISRSIIFAIETYGKADMGWSEEKDLPRSKGKKFQETKVTVNGKEYTLRRISYMKEVAA